MFKNVNLNIEELSRQLASEMLKPIRIIFLILNAGVILFNLIGIYIYLNNIGEAADPFYESSMSIYLIVELVFAAGIYLTAKILPERMVLRDTPFDPKLAAAQNIMGYYQTFMIMRLALLEGAALFGSVFLMLAILNYVLYDNPVYWIMIFPVFILFGYSILNFPTQERIALFYDKYKN